MNVRELRAALEGVPDDVEIVSNGWFVKSVEGGFTGDLFDWLDLRTDRD